MVSLAEQLFSLSGVSNSFVFQRHLLRIHRRLYDSPPIWLQHPVYLPAGQNLIVHMFHYMVTKDDVKRVVFERDLMNIHFNFCKRRLDISSDIFQVVQSVEPVDKAKLWCHM